MGKLNYLNAGCGSKFHNDWVNVDMTSHSPNVIAANLLTGFPFPDHQFDVVYHSQVLEHFPKEKAKDFISECYRVLKKDGIIRVVVPDLENIVDEYKKLLKENLENPTAMSAANYDWIMLELYDQTVRNYSGGQMAEYLKRQNVINEKYVVDRIGYVGRSIRSNYLTGDYDTAIPKGTPLSVVTLKSVVRKIKNKIFQIAGLSSEASTIGSFRLGGEVHLWMYDRYSLSRLLKDCGFVDVAIKSPFESDIPKWNEYELDVKDNLVYDPTSLFMEGRKKNIKI